MESSTLELLQDAEDLEKVSLFTKGEGDSCTAPLSKSPWEGKFEQSQKILFKIFS